MLGNWFANHCLEIIKGRRKGASHGTKLLSSAEFYMRVSADVAWMTLSIDGLCQHDTHDDHHSRPMRRSVHQMSVITGNCLILRVFCFVCFLFDIVSVWTSTSVTSWMGSRERIDKKPRNIASADSNIFFRFKLHHYLTYALLQCRNNAL